MANARQFMVARTAALANENGGDEAMYKELWQNYLSNTGSLSFSGLMPDGTKIVISGSQRLTFRYGNYTEIDLSWADLSNVGNYTFDSNRLKKLTIYKGVKDQNIPFRYGSLAGLEHFYILGDKLDDYNVSWWNSFTNLNKSCIVHLQDGEIYYDTANATWAKRALTTA